MHESLNMTEGVTQPMSDAAADPGSAPAAEKASLWRVLRDQKKTILVAVVMGSAVGCDQRRLVVADGGQTCVTQSVFSTNFSPFTFS